MTRLEESVGAMSVLQEILIVFKLNSPGTILVFQRATGSMTLIEYSFL